MDHFERLGLPRRFSVDASAIEREYLARSREVHPDFHSLGTAAQQRSSLEATAALNEAYLTLKDPYRRADYLLGLLGGPTAREEKSLDQAFLMEMMEYRERQEEATTDGERSTLESELSVRLDVVLAGVSKEFDAAAPRLAWIRQQLNAAKTIASLLRDLRNRE